ncbi:unnamed protein product [Pleuronectes platessa]|uniref:Uncharacterized protein n=1 Tax=Pleuronectes platessa TaxID=8262 RepID=A0A9N7VNL7_PLEPL|nr:unnamed protein product [Pleuronectes platessa]
MAKFVLAGQTDCPYYAKAELLADALQRCLPNFSIHKISILPDDWKEWLDTTCKTNNWETRGFPSGLEGAGGARGQRDAPRGASVTSCSTVRNTTTSRLT